MHSAAGFHNTIEPVSTSATATASRPRRNKTPRPKSSPLPPAWRAQAKFPAESNLARKMSSEPLLTKLELPMEAVPVKKAPKVIEPRKSEPARPSARPERAEPKAKEKVDEASDKVKCVVGDAACAEKAKEDGKTITTSVFTDEEGRYYFPPLAKGHYHVWAQAVGFEAGLAQVDDVKLFPDKYFLVFARK